MPLKNIIVDVIIRGFVSAICVAAMIAGSATIKNLWSIRHDQRISAYIDAVKSDVRTNTTVVGFMSIVMCFLVLPGIFTVVTHFSTKNLRILRVIITAVDFMFVLVATLGYGAAGSLGGATVSDWSDAQPYIIGIVKTYDPQHVKYYSHELDVIRRCTIAASVCSLLACGSCTLLLVFIMSTWAKEIREQRAQSYEPL